MYILLMIMRMSIKLPFQFNKCCLRKVLVKLNSLMGTHRIYYMCGVIEVPVKGSLAGYLPGKG